MKYSTIALLCWIAIASPASIASDVNLPTIIDLIAQQELQIKGYRFHALHHEKVIPTDFNLVNCDVDSLTQIPDKDNYRIEGDVVYDVRQGQYCINLESTLPWNNSESPYCSVREAWSFDGHTHQHWKLIKHGTNVPELNSPPSSTTSNIRGEVSTSVLDSGTLEVMRGSLGIIHMPPFIDLMEERHTFQHLSDALRYRRDDTGVDISTTSSGLILISFQSRVIKNAMTTISLDTSQGMAVTEVNWCKIGSDTPALRRVFKIAEVSPGIWLPTSTTYINSHDRKVLQTDFSSFEFNPNFSSDDFVASMPVGTFVDDYIERTTYRVNVGPQDDATKTKAFLVRHGLNPIDLQQKQTQKRPRASTWWWAGNACLLLCIVLLFFKYRWPRIRSHLLILSLVLASPNLARADIVFADGRWVVSHTQTKGIPLGQCGFNVTVATLELFSRTYKADILAECLKPTSEGTALSDIVAVLKGTGLSVNLRKDVLLSDLVKTIPNGTIAVVPVELTQRQNHYLLCMRRSVDTVVFVDPPENIVSVHSNYGRSIIQNNKRVVAALVTDSTDDKAIPLNDAITLPDEVNVGKAVITDARRDRYRIARIVLKNSSSQPVLITNVRTSCSCAVPDFRGGIILPDEKRELLVKVDTLQWLKGPIRKTVTIEYADGSSSKTSIVGEGVSEDALNGLSISQEQLFFEIEASPKSELQVFVRDLTVFGPEKARAAMQVTSDVPWISVDHTSVNEIQSNVHITINIDSKLAVETGRSDYGLAGVISVSTSPDIKPARITLRITARPVVHANPRIVRLNAVEGAFADVGIVSADPESHHFSIESLTAAPAGIEIGMTESPKLGDRLRVKCTKETKPGYYVGKAIVKLENESIGIAKFVIQVEPPKNN